MAMLNIVVQSAALSVFSNILAQIIDSYQKNAPLNIDLTPILQFVTYAILNTPINCVWQDWLESMFPSTKSVTVEKPTDTKEGNNNVTRVEKEQVLDVKNTIVKFLADQTIGAAFNIPLFIAIIGMLKGQNMDQIVNTVHGEIWDIYLSGLKLWPAVSLLSYTFIPAGQRVIFGSLAGVVWNIYLSLKAQ